MSSEDRRRRCEEWFKDRTVNPDTGSKMTKPRGNSKRKTKYMELEEECKKYDNEPGKLPVHIDGIPMPQSKKEWSTNEWTGYIFRNILFMIDTLKFITESDLKVMTTYARICEFGLEHNLVPDALREAVEAQRDLFLKHADDKNWSTGRPVLLVDKTYEDGYNQRKYVKQIQESLAAAAFNIITDTIDSSVMETLSKSHKMSSMIIYHKLVLTKGDIDREWLQVKDMDGPSDMNAFVKSMAAVVQEKRERAARHGIIESPEPEGAEFNTDLLGTLKAKDRDQLLAELKEACMESTDAIYQTTFDEMSTKHLRLMIKIPSGTKTKPRCYYVRNLYNTWLTAANSGKAFVDPMTRDRISVDTKTDIMKAMRLIEPDRTPPSRLRFPVQRLMLLKKSWNCCR